MIFVIKVPVIKTTTVTSLYVTTITVLVYLLKEVCNIKSWTYANKTVGR